MKVLSVFDGCGMAYQALKEAEIPVEKYFASEIDKFASQIATKNHPGIIQLGDVRKVCKGSLKGEKIDLLIGGSPCQDLSVNGKGKGLQGQRSALFWEFVRLRLRIKPKHFLLENVAGMKKENQAIISNILGVEPILIDSSLLTAQSRKRLYWTNIAGVEQPGDKDIKNINIMEHDNGETFRIKKEQILNNGKNYLQYDLSGKGHGSQDQRAFYLNGKSCCLSASSNKLKFLIDAEGLLIKKSTPKEHERLQGLPDNYTKGVKDAQRFKMIGNGFTVPVIAHILSYCGKKGPGNERD